MEKEKDLRRNEEHYLDPTPYEAFQNLEKFEIGYERFRRVLHIIFQVCALAGFEIEGRIVLIDKKTGRVWR